MHRGRLPTHLADPGGALAIGAERMRGAKEQHNALPRVLTDQSPQVSMPPWPIKPAGSPPNAVLLERVRRST